MFLLTRHEDDIESGTFATFDTDGTPIVQFFVDRDDAVTYKNLLEASGQVLEVTETDDDNVDKLCSVLGYAYTIAEPGEFVVPRLETKHHDSIPEDFF